MIFDFLTAHLMLGYVLLFLGMVLEGDIVLFTAGFLTYHGYFDIGMALLLVFSGALIGDNIWYVLGELVVEKKSFCKIKNFVEKATGPLDEHIRNRTARTIFISKFTYGLYRPVILKAGALKLPFDKFIKADLVATFIWVFIIGGLGYLSGASFLTIKHYLKYTELVLLLVIGIFILASHIVSKIFRKEL